MSGFLGDMSGVALVTGAGAGMGKATALAFAKAGAKVILVDMNEDALKGTASELPKDTVYKIVPLDITKDQEVIDLIQGIPKDPKFGRLDYALNCAGVLGRVRGVVANSSQQDDDWIFSINVRAQAIMTREELKVMMAQEPLPANGPLPKSKGCIVNWASYISNHGSATGWAYSASKHAIVGLTKSTAIGHAKDGIRCNAVAPGIMNTALMAGANQAQLERFVSMVPQGRLGEPEEVANLALFLCSDAASYINGSIVNIDGGWHAA